MSDGPNERRTFAASAILTEIDHSLRRLGMDYVDLYQIHRWDDDTPIEETLEALHDVVKAGKARYIGASSMYAWQFAKALYLADATWLDAVRLDAESLQPDLSRRRARDDAALPGRRHRRDSVEPAGARPPGAAMGARRTRPNAPTGDEFGKTLYAPTEDADRLVVDRVSEVAANRGVPAAQVALAWMLSKPFVTAPIIGATKPHHLQDAVAAVELQLSPEEIAKLEEPYVPHPVLGF